MRIDTDDLCDVPYIADQFGVTYEAVYNWVERHPEVAAALVEHRCRAKMFRWSRLRKWGITTGRLEEDAA